MRLFTVDIVDPKTNLMFRQRWSLRIAAATEEDARKAASIYNGGVGFEKRLWEITSITEESAFILNTQPLQPL